MRCALVFGLLLPIGMLAPACGGAGSSALLQPGARAPALQAVAHDGTIVDLANLGGRSMLVYFYPMDGTPGCTKEACAIRDAWQGFEAAGVTVVGVSTDDPDSHRAFAKKHRLPFLLISDEDRAWAKAFGVDSTLGLHDRDSFLIAPQGEIAKVYRGVDPLAHADDVLRDAAALKPVKR